LFLIEEA